MEGEPKLIGQGEGSSNEDDGVNIKDIILSNLSLRDKLKRYRFEKSMKQSIPPYCIFHNAVIDSICSNPPKTIDDLLSIKGIGKGKVCEYGADILYICGGLEIGEEIELNEIKRVSKKKKLYAVVKGHKPGIYKTWTECQLQTNGFTGNKFRSFNTLEDAEEYMRGYSMKNELPPNTELSDEQRKVLLLCDEGENVFMSGPGGSGKSHLVKLVVNRYPRKNIKVCALTGVAAELLGCDAKTIHSWSGTKLSKGAPDKIISNVTRRKKYIKAWKSVDILIVDEVSMMSKKYYEVLDSIGRTIRRVDEPFGGIQLLFSGDFHQLPPIVDADDPDTGKFCFESPSWIGAFKNVVILTHIFRQTDPVFTKILRQIRRGGITKKTHDILNGRIMNRGNKLSYGNKLNPTIISPLRNVVSNINKTNMDKLEGEPVTYTYQVIKTKDYDHLCKISDKYEEYEIDQLKKGMTCEQTLHLKVGSHVMCIANIDMTGSQQIVNGSQGVVERFIEGIPLVRFKNGLLKLMGHHSWMSDDIPGLGIQQIPLILSWAITIHKSQGITLDSAIVDAGDNVFEYGQTYVALSRVKTLEGLFLGEFNYMKIMTNPTVTEYYASL